MAINWKKYKPSKLTVTWPPRQCEICRKLIAKGERYHNGGPGYRAHVECVERQAEATPTE